MKPIHKILSLFLLGFELTSFAAPKTRFQNDVVLSQLLTVGGACTLSSTLGVTGAATLSSTLDVTGATSITGATKIGASGSADSKSILDLTSTTKGFLPPRMTTTQRDAISSPTTGLHIFNSTTSKPNVYNGSAWTDVGSGNSGINYFSTNPDAESSTTGWVTYADTAKNIPADATGGSPNSTWTRTTSTPLVGTGSFLWTKAGSANRQGEGVSFDFTIDSAFQSSALGLSFSYKAVSGTVVAADGITAPLNDNTTSTNAGNSDLEVFLYDVTNAALIPVTPQVLTCTSTTTCQFKGIFQTASNSTSYRFAIHTATTSTANYTVQFDNFFLGPQAILQGSPVTDPVSFTMSITATVSNPTKASSPIIDQAFWWREGKYMNIHYAYKHTSNTGAVDGSGTYLFNLPSGYSIDSSVLTVNGSNSDYPIVGSMKVWDNGNQLIGAVVPHSATALKLTGNYLGSGSGYNVTVAGGTFGISNSFASYNFIARVPISGWSSSVSMSNDASTSPVVARVYKSGTQAVTGTDTKITSWTVDRDSNGMWDASNNRFNIPVSGDYQLYLQINATGTGSQMPAYKITGGSTVYIGTLTTSTLDRTGGSGILTGLKAGDYVELYISPNANYTIQAGTGNTFASLSRISGPSAIAATDTIAAKYKTATAGSYGNGTTTIIDFSTKEIDKTGSVTTGASWAFTCPVSATYSVNSSLLTSGSTNAGSTELRLYKSGSQISTLSTGVKSGTTSGRYAMSGGTLVSCLAGETLDIRLNNQDGGTLTLVADNNFNIVSIYRVGNY